MADYPTLGFAFVRRTGGRPIPPFPSFEADFVENLSVPKEVVAGLSAPSVGNSKLIPVFGGWESADTPRLFWLPSKPNEFPIYGARRVFNESVAARLNPVGYTWNTRTTKTGAATVTITLDAGENPDGSAGAVRIHASRTVTSEFAGMNIIMAGSSEFSPRSPTVSTYWLRTHPDAASQSQRVSINSGYSGQVSQVTVTPEWQRFACRGTAAPNGACHLQVTNQSAQADNEIDVLIATDPDHCFVVCLVGSKQTHDLEVPEQCHPTRDYGFGAPGVQYFTETSGLVVHGTGDRIGGVVTESPKIKIPSVKGIRVLPALTNKALFTNVVDGTYGLENATAANLDTQYCPSGGSVTKLVGSGGSGAPYHRFAIKATVTGVPVNTWLCVAVLVNPLDIGRAMINLFDGSPVSKTLFNLRDKSVELVANGGPQNDLSNARIVDVGDGYLLLMVKCKVTQAMVDANTYPLAYYHIDYTDDVAKKGDAVSGQLIGHCGYYDTGVHSDPNGVFGFVEALALIRTTGTSAARTMEALAIEFQRNPIDDFSLSIQADADEVMGTVTGGRGRLWWIPNVAGVTTYGVDAPAISSAGNLPNAGARFGHLFPKGIARYNYTMDGPSGAARLEQYAAGVSHKVSGLVVTKPVFPTGKINLGGLATIVFPGYIRDFKYWNKGFPTDRLSKLGQ